MSSELEILQSLPLFSRLSARDWKGMDLLWEKKTLPKDEVLWFQGEAATEMAFLIEGELRVEINNQLLASIPKNELVGELATFTRDIRTASIIAHENCELLAITVQNFELMRESHSKVYDKILEVSLTRLAIRIQRMNRKIARISEGTDQAPTRKEDNVFSKFWKKISGGENKTPPSAVEAMRKLPKIRGAHPVDIGSIISMMTPRLVSKGSPLVLEGESGETCYLLVEGCIEVYRNVKSGKAQLLASLFPGALLGTGSLLLKERRNASCVANKSTDVWVYEMDRVSFNKLQGSAGRIWRESLLNSLAFQLRMADEILVKLEQGDRPKSTDYDTVRKSLSGF